MEERKIENEKKKKEWGGMEDTKGGGSEIRNRRIKAIVNTFTIQSEL